MPARGGSKNKSTEVRKRNALRWLTDNGMTPLDYMMGVMRGEIDPEDHKMDAAKSAAPFVHPRLAAIDMDATVEGTLSIVCNSPLLSEDDA